MGCCSAGKPGKCAGQNACCVNGKCRKNKLDKGEARCNACGAYYDKKYKFCPSCSAKGAFQG